MVKALFLAAALLMLSSAHVRAQRQYAVWYFGDRAGMDFNGGTPTSLTTSAMSQVEGSAVIADGTSGQLLFYTDGISVWNRNHETMPNGNILAPLFGAQSSTQSALIVPKPGDSLTFYIFTTDDQEDENRGLNYSVVDMRLDGGLGDVVVKNSLLLADVTEKLVGVMHANQCEIWVVTHGSGDNAFHAYHVTRNGVNPSPVVSSVGSVHPAATGKIGYLKASPDGKRLVSIISGEYVGTATIRSATIELFDFDNQTGQVTLVTELLRQEHEYGGSFSPDNSKLYISHAAQGTGGIYQYDLSSGDPAQIKGSRATVTADPGVGAMQIAPDGKIYVAKNSSPVLGVINNPNAAGAASGYVSNGFNLGGRLGGRGLPNNIDSYIGVSDACRLPIADFVIADDSICAGACVQITDNSRNSPTDWQWTFQGGTPSTSNRKNPGSVCFDVPGWHRVSLLVSNDNGSELYSDSLFVSPPPAADAGVDVSICLGRSATLKAIGGDTYQWSPVGDLSCSDCAEPTATPSATTTYYVRVTNAAGCEAIDSVTVTVTEVTKPVVSPSDTVVLCASDQAELSVAGSYVAYLWSTGASTPTIMVSTAGNYTVTVTDAGGCRSTSDTVVVKVNADLAPVISANGPTTFCEGDSVMLTAPAGFAGYQWSSGETTPSIVVKSSGSYTVTVVATGGCSATSPSVAVTVNPSPLPVIRTSGDLSACDGDSVLLDAGPEGAAYLWSTGEITRLIWARASGEYVVTVTTPEGCRRTSAPVTVVIGEAASAIVALPDIEAAPGEHITIQLEIPVSGNLANSCANRYTATVRFNKTLLKPIGVTPTGTIDGADRVLTISGDRSQATPTGVLARLEFVVALGSATSTPLTIERFAWDKGNVQTTLRQGELRLKNLCENGSVRLVDGNGDFGLKPLRPNPASGSVEIEYAVVESGRTRLALTDPLGRPLSVIMDARLDPGRYVAQVDISALPPGLYFCTLVTPTDQAQEQVLIVR